MYAPRSRAQRSSISPRGRTLHFRQILRGEAYDSAVDVYSFGLTVWEVFNFQKPWPGKDPKDIPYMVTVSFSSSMSAGKPPLENSPDLACEREERSAGVWLNAELQHRTQVQAQRPSERSHVPEYVCNLMRHCWADDPESRPGFQEIVAYLAKADGMIDVKRHVRCCGTHPPTAVAERKRSGQRKGWGAS